MAAPEVTSLITSAPTVDLSYWPSSLICLTWAGRVGSVGLAEGLGAPLRTEGSVNPQWNFGLYKWSPVFLFLTLFSALRKVVENAHPLPDLARSRCLHYGCCVDGWKSSGITSQSSARLGEHLVSVAHALKESQRT